MAKKQETISSAGTESDIIELIEPIEISAEENLVAKHKDELKLLDKMLKAQIEKEVPSILRDQISETFSYFARIGIWWAKSERSYRQFQMTASQTVPTVLKSDSRKMWLDGYCSNYRYQRDILAHYLEGIKSKLSAQKSILASLNQERRDAGLDEH